MSHDPFKIRDAVVDDVHAIARLVRSSFSTDMHPYIIAAQPRWSRFLSVVIGHPGLHPAHRYLVAVDDRTRIVGFAEFKVTDGAGFLSYICVDKSVRRRGLAGKLMSALVRPNSAREVELDVFGDNASAISLYRRLGFVVVDERLWCRAPLPQNSSAATVGIDNLPFALAAHDGYGFCEFVGHVDKTPFRCGRVGLAQLRCFTADEFNNAKLLGSLGAAFSGVTGVFAVLNKDSPRTLPDSTTFKTSLRMRATHLNAIQGIQ